VESRVGLKYKIDSTTRCLRAKTPRFLFPLPKSIPYRIAKLLSSPLLRLKIKVVFFLREVLLIKREVVFFLREDGSFKKEASFFSE
jgi:hypothetical protein